MKKIQCFIGIIVLCVSAYAVAQPIAPNAGEIYKLDFEWGSRGSEDGQFWNPRGVAVDASGYVYVADMDNYRVQKFASYGQFITKWGWYGTSDGDMISPSGVAVDSEGNVYVTDRDNHRVQKFTADGEFIAAWGTEVKPRSAIFDEMGELVLPESCDCRNRNEEQFLFPEEITVDVSGNVYVIDNCAIQKFTSGGQFLETWEVEDCIAEGATGGNAIRYGIAPDATGNIYLIGHLPKSDPEIALIYENYYLIYQYTADHQFINKWGTEEEGTPSLYPVGKFLDWSGIALDSSDNVYVVDRSYAGKTQIRIQKFTPTGQFITEWTTARKASNAAEVTSTGLAIDKLGHVFLLNGDSVQRFSVPPPVTTTTTTTSIPSSTTTTTVRPSGTEPTASFFVTPSTARVSATFTFNASGSTDKEDLPEDLIVRWDWENDGVWDTDYSSDKIATHQYSTAGSYTINLEVKDTEGLTDTTTRRIIVRAERRLCAASYLLGKDNPRLGALRKFRDNILAESLVGIKMVELYYRNGEKIIGGSRRKSFTKEVCKSGFGENNPLNRKPMIL